MAERVISVDLTGKEVNPGASNRWPVSHLNAGTAGVKQLLTAPGNTHSHFVTGFVMSGGAAADGFHLLRENCIQFTTTDTWTITDGGSKLDMANEASDGHMTIEAWMKIPTASAATNILTRGNPATTGYTFEITSGGLLKFTIKDASNALTATGTTVLNDGEWHFLSIVCERDSTTGLQLYVDGIAETLTAGSADTTSMNDAVAPASTAVQTGTSGKTHYLSVLGIYTGSSAALSSATILSNYNSGVGRKYEGDETGLALGFNNDEGISTAHHDIKNDAGYVVATSGTENVPSRQNGATAEINVGGVPFSQQDMSNAVGKFQCGIGTAFGGVVIKFPHPVKIGRNCPLSILETDGAFDLIVFGYTTII